MTTTGVLGGLLPVVLLFALGTSPAGTGVARAQQTPAQTPPSGAPPTPQLRIESFAAVHAFAVGMSPVGLVATIRNAGQEPVPANTVTARLLCLASLDYLDGDTVAKLPALEPNATVTLRWRGQPTDPDGALVAALALDIPGVRPEPRVLAVQHFADPPGSGTPSAGPAPIARVEGAVAVVENGKVRARVLSSGSGVPVLFLWTRTQAGWKQVGACLPLAEILSAEGAQRPWWEVFRADDASAATGKGEATLTLTGGIGLRWRASVELTLRVNSSVVDVRFKGSPLRPLSIGGVRLCPLMAGEGSFGASVTETAGSESSGAGVLAAVRAGDITVGTLWSADPPYPGWANEPLLDVTGAEYRRLGIDSHATGEPVGLQPGALLELRGRLFALTPSRSISDARRVALPTGK